MDFKDHIEKVNEHRMIKTPKILFETGLFKGGGVERSLNLFEKIYSCDIMKEFVDNAKEHFKHRHDVTILHGDSKDCLKVSLDIDQPILFYLDAHFSGGKTGGENICNGCPVLEELKVIGQRKHKDVVIIDDLRLMGVEAWSGVKDDPDAEYPYTLFDFRHATIDNMLKAYGREVKMYQSPYPDRLILIPEN